MFVSDHSAVAAEKGAWSTGSGEEEEEDDRKLGGETSSGTSLFMTFSAYVKNGSNLCLGVT